MAVGTRRVEGQLNEQLHRHTTAIDEFIDYVQYSHREALAGRLLEIEWRNVG
jgi:hypothetical protein